MRKARIKITGRGAVYHCVSRVVGEQMLLGRREKDQLQETLWQQVAFSGVEVITYCLMSSHFHVLVRVPSEIRSTDAELVARSARFYGGKSLYVQTLRQAFQSRGALPEELRVGLQERLGDASSFMKELKQRFSKWYNREQNRFGTLWAERFKSVLVEDEPRVVQMVAAYVDLNPVRAGLVDDPKRYRWCGYGEAAAGGEAARKGLASCHDSNDWAEVNRDYRKLLMGTPSAPGKEERVVLDRNAIREELKRGGDLALPQVLRLRLRHFSDGLVLGSRDFVNGVFADYRDRFGPRRKTGARRLRRLDALGDLTAMRDLQVNVVR
jgi:REP element-mobilizing transposase RayT